jgi:hypothetical protein
LLYGGYSDPLAAYERAYSGLEDKVSVYRRTGEGVALRFSDPLERKDAAGRIIPHDFVVLGSLAEGLDSVDAGIQTIWPLVSSIYEDVWDEEKSPSAEKVGLAFAERLSRG